MLIPNCAPSDADNLTILSAVENGVYGCKWGFPAHGTLLFHCMHADTENRHLCSFRRWEDAICSADIVLLWYWECSILVMWGLGMLLQCETGASQTLKMVLIQAPQLCTTVLRRVPPLLLWIVFFFLLFILFSRVCGKWEYVIYSMKLSSTLPPPAVVLSLWYHHHSSYHLLLALPLFHLPCTFILSPLVNGTPTRVCVRSLQVYNACVPANQCRIKVARGPWHNIIRGAPTPRTCNICHFNGCKRNSGGGEIN